CSWWGWRAAIRPGSRESSGRSVAASPLAYPPSRPSSPRAGSASDAAAGPGRPRNAMSQHDVVVIGAGPGGAATAHYLAVRGVDVLLVDRAHFPRDKTCGDGLTPRALD